MGRTRKQRRIQRRRRSAAKKRGTTIAFDPSAVVAVVDTNVLLELMLIKDMFDAFLKAREEQDAEAEANAFYRIERAAYALRMAIYFHETRAITLCDGQEVLKRSTELVAPEAIDGHGWYRHLWLAFSKPLLLRNWRIASDSTHGTGNAIDNGLIALAKQFKCPLISNEGVGANGPTGKKGIRTKGPKAGVTVMTAEEFCRQSPLSRTRWKRFLRTFQRLGPSFHKDGKAHEMAQIQLGGLFTHYERLLLGTEPDAIADRAERFAAEKRAQTFGQEAGAGSTYRPR